MPITIDFSPADAQLIQEQAYEKKISPSDFIRNTILKSIHNAEYMAEINRRTEDIRQGKNIVSFSDEEWEQMVNEKEFS